MKTPHDSRPRFQSANRHYHRYREENPDGWNDWISPGKNEPGRKRMSRGWLVAALAVIALIGLVGMLYLTVR